MSFYGYLVDLHTNQVLIIISFLILTVVEDRNFKIVAYVQTLDVTLYALAWGFMLLFFHIPKVSTMCIPGIFN